MKTLIIGGARSGKSSWATRQAQASGRPVRLIATACAGDDVEMQQRIDQHRRSRPADWLTLEEPRRLGSALRALDQPDGCLVVDCLTVWLANVLFDGDGQPDEAGFTDQRKALLQAVAATRGQLILISNETGLGVVPLGAGNRRFVDESGRLQQELAALCDEVLFMAAGLPLWLKGGPR